MELRPVNIGILSVWRLRLFVFAMLLSLAALVALWWIPSGWKWGVAPLFALICLGTVWQWWRLARLYRSLRFGIDATGIRIERGIWWRSIVALPRARIQHSD